MQYWRIFLIITKKKHPDSGTDERLDSSLRFKGKTPRLGDWRKRSTRAYDTKGKHPDLGDWKARLELVLYRPIYIYIYMTIPIEEWKEKTASRPWSTLLLLCHMASMIVCTPSLSRRNVWEIMDAMALVLKISHAMC